MRVLAWFQHILTTMEIEMEFRIPFQFPTTCWNSWIPPPRKSSGIRSPMEWPSLIYAPQGPYNLQDPATIGLTQNMPGRLHM